jgi:hypothetical protein
MSKTEYSITEIEAAINVWRNVEAGPNVVLGSNARKLAEIYGLMIFKRADTIDVADLTAQQIESLTAAQNIVAGNRPGADAALTV